MTKIDQFESIFRAATKEKFEPEAIRVDKILTIADQDPQSAAAFTQEVKDFLQGFADGYAPTWTSVSGDQFSTVHSLLELIENEKPDLISTYRNLHTPASDYPFSLGVFVDVLTQVTSVPILLMPRPELQTSEEIETLTKIGTTKVMAITDHLSGDNHLVNVAALLVKSGGKLLLTHVEDQKNFERFLGVIDKIPEIDSEVAKKALLDQLLAEPTDYIESCRQSIEQSENVEIESIVTVGHRLKDYVKLIEERDIDLLILHTKDEDQLAMHGLAYPLAVELRTVPMLLL